MKPTAIIFLFICSVLTAANGECACSMPASILEDYDTETSPVFKAKAIEKLNIADPHYTYTRFEYNFVFRNCPPPQTDFIVKSPSTSDSCGVKFELGVKYLLTLAPAGGSTPLPGTKGLSIYKSDSCHVVKKWSEVEFEVANRLYYSEVRGCIA